MTDALSAAASSSAAAGEPLLAQLQQEAQQHTQAVTTEVLAEETIHHADEQRIKQKQEAGKEDHPSAVQLPDEIEVTDASSLSAEIARLSALLSSLTSPWTVREASLKRLSALAHSGLARQLPNFPQEMWNARTGLAMQLTDRRSLVIKQTCASVMAVSAYFKEVYLPPVPADATAEQLQSIQSARKVWIDLTLFFLDSLLPLIPITVAVISSSAAFCVSTLLKHIAALYDEQQRSFPVLSHLLSHGITSKHSSVREHCYRGIAHSIVRMDERYIKQEQKEDEEEAEKIKDKLESEAAAKAAAAESEEADAVSSPVSDSSSPSSSPATSPTSPISSSFSLLFSRLEHAISSGLRDSDTKTRSAARRCLLHLRTLSPARSQRIVARMSPAQRKIFQEALDEFLVKETLAGTEAANSDLTEEQKFAMEEEEMEAELNPAPSNAGSKKKKKKKGKSVAPSSSASSAASEQRKDQLAAAKKAAKEKAASSSDASIVVSGKSKPSAAELAEKKKEEDAAAALAAKEEEKDDADEESSPLSSAPRSRSTSEVDDDASSDEKESSLVSSSSAPYRRNQLVLEKLLDLDSPALTDKMLEFLLMDGVMSIFLDFITRLPTGEVDMDKMEEIKSFEEWGAKYRNRGEEGEAESDVPLSYRHHPSLSDEEEQTATRRSFHVMQLLCNQRNSQHAFAVLSPQVASMILQLLTVFHPKSKGNFFHACSVLQKILSIFKATMLKTICSPRGLPLLSLCLDHLHEPPVLPFLLSLFEASVQTRLLGNPHATDVIHHLQQMDVLHGKLLPRIVQHPAPSKMAAQAATDFIMQYVEKIQKMGDAKQALSMVKLLSEIGAEGKAIAQLTDALLESSPSSSSTPLRPSWQLSHLSLLLHTFLSACSPATVVVEETDPSKVAIAQMTGMGDLKRTLPNPLFIMKKRITAILKERLPQLCTLLTHGNTDAEEVERKYKQAVANAEAAAASTTHDSPSSSSTSSPSSSPIHFSSYVVASSFTARRLQLLKIIVTLLQNDMESTIAEASALSSKRALTPVSAGDAPLPSPAHVLSAPRLFLQVPSACWSTLLDWFFAYLHNNFYLHQFKALFTALLRFAVKTDQAIEEYKKEQAKEKGEAETEGEAEAASAAPLPSPPSIDSLFHLLFVDLKFVARMVSFYQDASQPPSCTRSYLLEIGQHLRLSSDLLSHSSLVWTYLQSSQQWHTFLPLLRSEAERQARNLHVQPVHTDSDDGPEQQALRRALGLFRQFDDGPPPNPLAFVVPEGYGAGVELGSVWAWHLGFTEKSAAGVAGTPNKKRKKKKKKKKASANKKRQSMGGEEESDEEGEEGDGAESDSSTTSSVSNQPSPQKA